MQCKVLIVDDDPFLVISLKLHFCEIGIDAEGASDAIEALDKIDVFEPDIILSDITMPGMNGFEFYSQLRNNPDTEFIPVIFLTAKDDINDQIVSFRMGIDDYVCKPFQTGDLVDRMLRAIKRGETIRSLKTRADISGNLSHVAWTDILQLLELNYKTGELIFLSPLRETIGKIIFNKGRVANAQLGHLEGEEAFYAFMTVKEGFFEFFSKPVHLPPLVNGSNNSILLQGSRMLDEYQNLLRLLPDLNVPVNFSGNHIPAEIENNLYAPWVLKIYTLIERKLSVENILNSGQMSTLRAASILWNLLKKGIMVIGNHDVGFIQENSKRLSPEIDQQVIKIMAHIERRGLTGILEFRNRSQIQAVYFQNGQLFHAIHGDIIGKKAIFRIFSDQGGLLKFLQQPISVPNTIKNSLSEVLQEGINEIKTLQKVEKELASKRLTVNHQKVEKILKNKNISELRDFISLVRRHSRVCDVIAHSRLSDGKTYEQLNFLLDKGIVELNDTG